MMSFSTRFNPSGMGPTTSTINGTTNNIDDYYHQAHHQALNQNQTHNSTQLYPLDLQQLNHSQSESNATLTTDANLLLSFNPAYKYAHHPPTSPVVYFSPISSNFSSEQGARFSSQSPLIPQTYFQPTYQSSSPLAMNHQQKQQSSSPYSFLNLAHQSRSDEDQKMHWKTSQTDEKVTIFNEEVNSKVKAPANLVFARDHAEIIGHSRTVCGRKYREYPCQYCNKLFARPSTLLQHNRVHTGERPYNCEVKNCKQTFNILSNARRHTKRHLSSIESGGRFDQE